MRSSHSTSAVLSATLLALLSLQPTAIWAAQTLDVTNVGALEAATTAALKQLVAQYDAAPETDREIGAFNQAPFPWWASGVVWAMIMDYTKWSDGDVQFNDYAVGGLANMSYNNVQDVLNGDGSDLSGLMGRWNDDIGWVGDGIQNGAEIYGADAVMPGTGGGEWQVVGPKTAAQMQLESDEQCGGGIYWSRNRYTDDQYYKSTIANSEFVALAARIYSDSKNETLLTHAKEIWSWMSTSGIMTSDGKVFDGVDTRDCTELTTATWSYNAGQAINAAVWLYEATGDSSYLDQASSLLASAQSTFASNGNVVAELCETKCARDSKNFKAILLRSMAYLYRVTSNANDKSTIETIISSSVGAMVTNCDANWSCSGNWTTSPINAVDIADQHVSSALLVAALGVYSTKTTGIKPQLGKVAEASAASAGGKAGEGPTSRPVVESSPLNGASSTSVSVVAVLFAALLAFGSCIALQ